ncbi:winged helix-turn-helix domain-containing protein [Luteimonas terrae]|uniref:DNA-binding winged helix-turn-helix (WHTH) protein/tetratricopeptide (TPR) repeat protein n=1 Tax=Luteimonas terrae TaxID=1530191 RepID=A0ABU1XXB5_9GAMM|nr:winged helix-turn-helix domain-containing protein [Luteimonas terrae]MDR7193407.1 DNA-binding winged helix-turn-helix (wHTH) protein/tetratricopeptide (TPR) repeat protein [Luteimonas terrae]
MSNSYRFSDYLLDCNARELRRDGRPVAVPARVFACLQHLLEHRERAVARDELAMAVFARDNVSDAQLSQIILRARRAVGDDGQEQRVIRTVPSYGFRWVAEVEVLEAPDAASPSASVAPIVQDAQPHLPDGPVPTGDPGPQSAIESARPAPRHGRLMRWSAATLVVLGLLAALAWWALPRSAPDGDPAAVAGAIVVLPAELVEAPDVAWARLGLMDFIGDRLRRAGLPVAGSESVLSLLHAHQGVDFTPAQLRDEVSGDWVIRSRATRRGAGWRVEITAEGRDAAARHAFGEHADLLHAADQASGRLLAALGRNADGPHVDASLSERLQRAQAALLSNELEAARRILAEAPAAQRADPRLRLRMAQIDFRAGLYGKVREDVERLLATEAAVDPLFRADVLLLRAGIDRRLDQRASAERDYTEVLALVGADGDVALQGDALNGRGMTRALLGNYEGALADLGRARILMTRTGDPLAVARVDASLGFLEKVRGRPAQAAEYIARTLGEFRRFGAIYELVSMSVALAETQLLLLQPDEARASMEQAWALRARISDPSQLTNIALGRAEAMVRQGQLSAAESMLQSHADGPTLASDLHRADALRVEMAWRRGDPAAAVRIADGVLARWHADARAERLFRVRWMRHQAALEAGLPLRADAAPQPASADTGYAWDWLLVAMTAQAQDRDADAGRAYRIAVARAEQDGVPEEVAQAVYAGTTWLLAHDDRAEATALVGRIAPWARQDFDLALLQTRLLHALGQADAWSIALQDAKRLAGERAIPVELQAPPSTNDAGR